MLCWPHHFDIATLVKLEDGQPANARSIGVGVSPGDEYYAQPYVYVSPWPRFDAGKLPDLPPYHPKPAPSRKTLRKAAPKKTE